MSAIEPLRWDLLDTATATLTRAFAEEPIFKWVIPDPQRRARALEVMNILSTEGRSDPDWAMTRKRAVIGLVTSSAGILISALWLVLVLIAIAAVAVGRH